ncbi:MAG: hypothetical protein JHD33_05255 [Chthoniobacterales bacterium]|nr:hypothetical protein [Chthoniobacterales bacterium]
MKTLITLSLTAWMAVSLVAQTDTTQPVGKPHAKEGARDKPHQKKRGPMDVNLPPDEMQPLAAAREKAKNDPTVRSLQEARAAIDVQLENAMRAAMLSADPSLGPILDKVKAARGRAKDLRARFESLRPEQKLALKAARESVKTDPAVQAAREKFRAAQGPEAKKDAARELLQAMRAAVLEQNPELGPLLDLLRPPRDRKGPSPGGGEGTSEPEDPTETPVM